MIRQTATGVEMDVRVIPRARKTEFAGQRGDAVLIRLSAPPVDGAANDVLVAFVAARFGLARRSVRLVSGERSRDKRLAIEGITEATARARISE